VSRRPTLLSAFVALAVLLPVLALLVIVRLYDRGPSPASPEQRPRSAYRGSQPPPGLKMPAFTLHSYRGNLVSSRVLRGRVLLVTFLDTECREKCPIIASVIGAAIPLLPREARARVTAVAITVDPPVDTPTSVRKFLRARGALGRLDFLLGRLPELRPVWKRFGVLPAVSTGSADVHSADVRVFTPRGTWVSTLHSGVDLTPANLAHDAELALRATP
jgi:cytochrome oxidase Cu insertion factor (SCO1/SenC/PrrC family)